TAAWFGVDDPPTAKAPLKDQGVIFGRAHYGIMRRLYARTVGSRSGYAAGLPLLARLAFREPDRPPCVCLRRLRRTLTRAATGWVSDRWGGGRVTFWTFAVMIAAVGGVLYFLSINEQPGAFWGFFAMFMVLFAATGVGNASTFQMIPVIMRKEIDRL